MRNLAAFGLGVAVLHGCSAVHHAVPPVHTIYVLDSTASIVPSSFSLAVESIKDRVREMQRGDCITVLPIISDSDAIPSDEIVRGCAPTGRQPYDQDLKAFRQDLSNALDEQSHKLAAIRSVQTDLIGTMDLVDQELALDTPTMKRRVILFSDFIEEDRTRNFIRMHELGNSVEADKLARQVACAPELGKGLRSPLSGVPVLLAGLQSLELPRLAQQRREAIRHFWVAYLEARGAKPTYVNDGPGISRMFLSQLN